MSHPLYCDTCRRVGSEEDLCFNGEPCPDDQCDGTVSFVTPTAVATLYRSAPDTASAIEQLHAEVKSSSSGADHAALLYDFLAWAGYDMEDEW